MNRKALRLAMVRNEVTSFACLASEVGLSQKSFFNKVNGRTEFKVSEIKKIAEILNLSERKIFEIFFEEEENDENEI